MSNHSSILPLRKKLLFGLVMLAIPLMTLELGARAYFAYQLGSSVLFYGTRLNRESAGDAHSGDMNLAGGYIKYHPHEERFTRDKETGRLIRATINSHGFRGREFNQHKAPNVIRVVTLGASSTFGFSDRDDETYPCQMEEMLNRGPPPGRRFEVINLGIPHLKSDQIRALFEAEALPLHPDVVTFYEGINDSWVSPVLFKKEASVRNPGVVRQTLRRSEPLHRAFRWLRDHFVTINLIDGYVKRERSLAFTAAEVEEHMRGKSEHFLANVSAIRDECRRCGITFVAATQQAKSYLVDRKRIRGVTYQEERELVRQDLARNGHITRYELDLLTHAEMMDELRKWASDNHVLLVDAIAATDQRRDCLLTWVHLNAEGNGIVARAFAGTILEEFGQASLNGVARHKAPVAR